MSTDSKICLEAESLSPNLMVESVAETVDFYVNKLGFKLNMSVNEDKSEFADQLKPEQDYIWAQLLCGNIEVMVQRRDSFEEDVPQLQKFPIAASATLYIRVKAIEKLFNYYQEQDIKIIKNLATTWYGMQEFYIFDNNGYIICFGEADPSIQM